MRRFVTLSGACAVLFLMVGAAALGHSRQAPSQSQVAVQAASAYDAKNWNEAAKLFGQIAHAAPSPRVWYRLGVSLNKAGEKEAARVAAAIRGIWPCGRIRNEKRQGKGV